MADGDVAGTRPSLDAQQSSVAPLGGPDDTILTIGSSSSCALEEREDGLTTVTSHTHLTEPGPNYTMPPSSVATARQKSRASEDGSFLGLRSLAIAASLLFLCVSVVYKPSDLAALAETDDLLIISAQDEVADGGAVNFLEVEEKQEDASSEAESRDAALVQQVPSGGQTQKRQLAAESDNASGTMDGLITLNLTRQQMAIQKSGGVMLYKSAYWGTLHVGSPAQPFRVVFDTGSGHVILPSSYCHSDTCRNKQRYKRSKSTSAVDIDFDGSVVEPGQPRDQITVSFGTGDVTGVFVEERVCLSEAVSAAGGAGGKGDAYATKESFADSEAGCMKMRVIAATAMSEEPFRSFEFDGVLGLSLAGLSQAPEFNFMGMVSQAVKSWGGKQPETFSVFLTEHPEENSQLSLGGWDKNHFVGDLSWTPVHDPEQGHWMVRIKSLRVDGELVRFCDDGTCRGVVDTGTSLLSVPTALFPEVYQLLRHEPNGATGRCHGPGPNFEIELENGFVVTMAPRDYARVEQGVVVGKRKQKWGKQLFSAPPSYCKPMLMTMDLPEPVGPKILILGEPVLRKYFTVYDAETARVGIALARHLGPVEEAPDTDVEETDDAREDDDGHWDDDDDFDDDE